MKPISFDEILSAENYDRVRDLIRPLVIQEKNRRRLIVGSHITLLFENRQTAWYQIEEMVRTEKLAAREAIQHEIETYNELVPQGGELVATMLIEYSEVRERDAALRRLVGLERHMWLVVDAKRLAVKFDDRQMSDERVSSVQFVRFPLDGTSAEQFHTLAQAGKVRIEVDHPNLAAEAPIAGALADALSEDLR
ncbi:MAG TPA: DUF3501 family protein [Candidatus Binataceae bacterium]|nr:DUF3501 family protein [Candidatus Binataceae bacterium]